MKSPAIFAPIDELINLVLPILLIAWTVAGMVLGWPAFGGEFWDRIIVDLVLLNVTHNAFTFVLMATLPEFKPWLAHQGLGSAKRFWRRTILLFLALLAFFFAVFMNTDNQYLRITFLFFNLALPIHHSLSQSFGLSLLYNGKQVAKTEPTENRERRLTQSMIAIVVVGGLYLSFMIDGSSALNKIIWPLIQVSTVGVAILIALNMLFYPKELRFKKILFSLRYGLYPLGLYSPVALAGTKIVHGTEYLFATRRAIKRSSGAKWVGVGISSVLFVTVFGYFREEFFMAYSNQTQTPLWIQVVAAVSVAITFMHYYLDRKIFRFRHEINRQTMGKLLG